MAEQPQRTRDEVKGLLERGTIADLKRLIANPGCKNRSLVLQVLELYETASDPFLGMNLPDQKQRHLDKARAAIEPADAEAQAHQDWSNDE